MEVKLRNKPLASAQAIAKRRTLCEELEHRMASTRAYLWSRYTIIFRDDYMPQRYYRRGGHFYGRRPRAYSSTKGFVY